MAVIQRTIVRLRPVRTKLERMVVDQLEQRADVAGRARVLGGVLDEPMVA